jgi:hypothetical protein
MGRLDKKVSTYQVDNMILKKEPDMHIATPREEGVEVHQDFWLNVADDVIEAIEKESFPRCTEGWHCSEKMCGYWGVCKPYKRERSFIV